MALDRIKAKGRRDGGAFVALPCHVLSHSNFSRLTAKGVKLLIDLCAQLNMKKGGPINNGDLTIAWSIMLERAWKSKQTLHNAKEELLYYEWIMLTRQGGRHVPSLYALTFYAINECGGKLEARETVAAPGTWKTEKPIWVSPHKLKTVPRQSYHIDPTIVPIGTKKEAIR